MKLPSEKLKVQSLLLMIRSVRLEKSLEIYAQKEKVFNHLADVRNQIQLHPYYCEVRLQDRLLNEQGQVELNFEAIEEMSLLGLMPWRSKHQCKLVLCNNKDFVEYNSASFPGVRLKAVLSLTPAANGKTFVQENLLLRSPAVIFNWVSKVVSETHNSMLRTLKLRLEEM
jgi:hypothetical protein